MMPAANDAGEPRRRFQPGHRSRIARPRFDLVSKFGTYDDPNGTRLDRILFFNNSFTWPTSSMRWLPRVPFRRARRRLSPSMRVGTRVGARHYSPCQSAHHTQAYDADLPNDEHC